MGKTVGSIEARWQKHTYKGYALHAAILKYGQEAFSVVPVGQFSTNEQASTAEQLFILELQTKAPAGYNLTEGGEGSLGLRLSEETKAKLRTAHLGTKRPPISEEHRRRLSQALSGKPKSEAHRKRMSEIRRGKKHSAEWCRKRSELMKGTNNPNYRHGQRMK